MATVQHSTQTGLELHEDKRVKEPVRAASTANVTLATPGAALDGVTLSSGDRILLKNQTAPAENGIRVWTGAATPLTRASDTDVASDFVYGFLTYVREGTTNGGSYWTYTQSGAVTLETTAITFASFGAGSGTVTSVALTVPSEFSVTGSPVTSSGTLAVSKATQSANTHFSGPVSGGTSSPTFRALVSADLPVLGASGVSHAAGAAPDPGAGAGTAKFLREDATWQVPSGTGGGGSSTGGGGSGALVPIMVVGPITASQTTLPFAGIPQTGFRNLRVVVYGRGTVAANNVNLGVQFNGDVGANYSYETLADASGGLNRLSSGADTAAYLGFLPASTAGAGQAGTLDIKIPAYTGTTLQKAFHAQGSFEQSTSAGSQYNQDGGGFWRNTAPISSLTLVLSGGSFDIGSYACLYGEMDTAGVLLTPASNLLYEAVLTATTATLAVPSVAQGYRDLRVVVIARTDGAGTSVADLTLQLNGNTTSGSYSWASGGNNNAAQIAASGSDTSMHLGSVVPQGGTTANLFSSSAITIADYTKATQFHTVSAISAGSRGTAAGDQWVQIAGGNFKVAAAIVSMTFGLSAGSFVAGSCVRIYGEPASAGGASVGVGTRLRLSGNQSITTATATAITWDTEDTDADNQHYTSAANLTGTVSKTAASTTLAGSSTVFLTELSVGQVISVPGTAAEKRVVVAIASNTSLTVNTGFANTAAAQTATRVNTAVVFRQPGFYSLEANVYSAALASGAVTVAYYLNSLTTVTSGTAIGQRDPVAVNASAGYDLVSQRQFQQWDFVEVVWTQNSGGSVNVLADERTHFSISARPTVIVAVPYVRIIDSKAQNTAGGTFSSGADQTRTLNTIDVDTGGISALGANQITLPPGTYEYAIIAPGYQCGAHQAFLYNATDTAEVKRGTSESSGITAATTTTSRIKGSLTLTAAKALEVRHRCTTTSSTNGFGLPANFGAETYTTVEFKKVG